MDFRRAQAQVLQTKNNLIFDAGGNHLCGRVLEHQPGLVNKLP